jgi:tyrosyl-tRNA synthetase
MPLLEGLDGSDKMSKSKGNYIGILEPAQSMFGKMMSISDERMWRYYELLSFRPPAEVARLRQECETGRNPRDAKVMLAQEIVTRFHSRADAEARLPISRRASRRRMPRACGGDATRRRRPDCRSPTCQAGGLVESTSEALRLIAQRGSRSTATCGRQVAHFAGAKVVVQAGKRKFARVTLT